MQIAENTENRKLAFKDVWIFVLDLFVSLCLYNFLELKLVIGLGMVLIAAMRMLFTMRISNYGAVKFLFWFVPLWVYIFYNGLFVTEYYFGWKTQLIYIMPHLATILYYSVGYSRDELFEIFCKSCKIACWISAGYILIVDFSNVGQAQYRLGSGVSNPNTVAMAFCLFFSIYLYESIFVKKKNMVQVVVLALMILLTGSKKGVLGIIIIVAALCIFKYKSNAFKYILPLVFLLCLYWLINTNDYFYSIIGRRIDAFFYDWSSGTEVGSTAARIGMYREGWEYFLQKPFLGHGYGFFTYSSSYGTYSHSNYIEMLVSFGLLGAGFFYYFLFKLLSVGIKKLNTSEKAPLLLLLIIFNLIMQFMLVDYYGTGFLYETMFWASAILLPSHSRES